MKNTLLSFCYAVEIGAQLAYEGHYKVTKDKKVKQISKDEIRHQLILFEMLKERGSYPNALFNLCFIIIGNIIKELCGYFPRFMLNKVANIMELFNIFSYSQMAKIFPEYRDTFLEMQKNEQEHSVYFA